MKSLTSLRVGILMGGWSSEREVSLRSARRVQESLSRQGIDAVAIDIGPDFSEQILKAGIDVAFVVLHGRPGEDGTIQGFLELAGIPYTGSGVEASAIGIDKLTTKRLFREAGIPTPDWVAITEPDDLTTGLNSVVSRLRLPVVVKPRSEGSSVGIAIVHDRHELQTAVRDCRNRFGDIIVEQFVSGMTATVGILGEQPLPILELVPRHRAFYDFQAKYTAGATEFIIPARLTPEVTHQTQQQALRCHQTLGCSGFSRVDVILEDNRHPYFLEVNTIPGLTEISDLPAEAEHAGISYDQLVVRILESAALKGPSRPRQTGCGPLH